MPTKILGSDTSTVYGSVMAGTKIAFVAAGAGLAYLGFDTAKDMIKKELRYRKYSRNRTVQDTVSRNTTGQDTVSPADAGYDSQTAELFNNAYIKAKKGAGILETEAASIRERGQKLLAEGGNVDEATALAEKLKTLQEHANTLRDIGEGKLVDPEAVKAANEAVNELTDVGSEVGDAVRTFGDALGDPATETTCSFERMMESIAVIQCPKECRVNPPSLCNLIASCQ